MFVADLAADWRRWSADEVERIVQILCAYLQTTFKATTRDARSLNGTQ